MVCPSIHFCLLHSSRSRWYEAKQSSSEAYSNFIQLLLGHPKVFPGQMGYGILLACSGYAPCMEDLHRKASSGNLSQTPEPTQLAPFSAKEQQFYSELLPEVCTYLPVPYGWALTVNAVVKIRFQLMMISLSKDGEGLRLIRTVSAVKERKAWVNERI